MKAFQLCVLALLALHATAELRRYDGYQLLSFFPKTKAETDFIFAQQADTELDFWREAINHIDVLVPAHKVASFKQLMTSHSISFIVADADIQRGIDEEQTRLAKKAGMAIDYDDFNTFDNIITELDNIVARCPPTVSCETFEIGQSYEGRPIKGVRIFRGTGRPAIWMDATIHAREWLSTATHLKIMQHLVDDYTDPIVENFLDTYDWWLIPVSNPDGYVFTHTDERLWRKNRSPNSGSACVGTDLNRNFDQMWGNAGASTNACSDTYRGASAGSEPETQAVQAAVLARASNLITAIHFHTYGQYWLMPWGSTVSGGQCNYADDNDEMLVVANAAADAIEQTYNTNWLRGNSCATIYPASGITMDYSKGVAGVKYTFTPELRGGSFVVSNTQIEPSFVEVWNGLIATIRAIEQAK